MRAVVSFMKVYRTELPMPLEEKGMRAKGAHGIKWVEDSSLMFRESCAETDKVARCLFLHPFERISDANHGTDGTRAEHTLMALSMETQLGEHVTVEGQLKNAQQFI